MKFFILFLALTAVIAVPINQVPEAEKQAEAKVQQPAKVETAVENRGKTPKGAEETAVENRGKTPKGAEETAVENRGKTPKGAEETAVENRGKTPKVAEETAVENRGKTPKVAEETAVENRGKTPKGAEETAVENRGKTPKAEEAKGQALTQVMKAISEFAAPFAGEEFNMLKDVMEKGTDILAKAEEKAREIHSHPEFQTLIQADSLFGIKNDGTIDADVATNQLTQLMGLLTGTQMSEQEKTLVHELIGGFSSLFAPIVSGSDSMTADLEKLAQQFTSKFDKISSKLGETPKDRLLEPQTLLSVMTEDDGAIDTQLLSQVTEKFMDKISSQFEKVMGTLEKLEEKN